MQRGATRATVYSTFSVTIQTMHTTRGRATIVRRTVTAPPDNSPAEHIPTMPDACVHNALALHSDFDDPKKAAYNTAAKSVTAQTASLTQIGAK